VTENTSRAVREPAQLETRRKKGREKSARYRARHLDAVRAHDRDRAAAMRQLVFGHYGDRCACCGSADDLTLDHVAGNGREHRLTLFGNPNRAGHPFYRWLIAAGFPDGYQPLCRRCGSSKHRGPACRLHTAAEAA
jgi:hypothetical protein